MQPHDDARAALAAWRAQVDDNFFEGDSFFQAVLRAHLGEAGLEAERAGLSRFGAECAGPIDQAARETNRDENLPRVRRWDDHGRRTEEIVFHPDYFALGDLVYRTGIIARYERPGQELVQLAYAYLLCHNGEAGHMCPVACTAGLVKTLQTLAEPALQDRLLPRLFHPQRSDPEHAHGAQWLTEIQGGSDVGTNACVARREDGTWRIHGEKWFCSVVDADLAVVTARPEGAPSGTRGLATFVVPRHLDDGSPNHYSVRRLKTKLGTRSMASAELDFEGAEAWLVGAARGGFGKTVEIVLTTSRLHNAVAATGMMRRVELEASSYAQHREAFGRPILQYPLVRATLDGIRAQTRAAVASTFDLCAAADRLARGEARATDASFHRMGVCMNKYWTSVRATQVIHDGIEVLGGNGAIEDFSILPRLLRDAIVMENWEGTHNVLCAQVLKDMHRAQVHEGFFAHLDGLVSGHPALTERLAADRAAAQRLLDAPAEQAAYDIRGFVDRLMVTWQAAAMLQVKGVDVQPDVDRLLVPKGAY